MNVLKITDNTNQFCNKSALLVNMNKNIKIKSEFGENFIFCTLKGKYAAFFQNNFCLFYLFFLGFLFNVEL